jgi:hypothetical protein
VIVDTPVNLIAGHDYLLWVEDVCGDDLGSRDASLKDPGGNTVITVTGFCDATGGEFRAKYTATYFIEYDDIEVSVKVIPDCSKDITTHCHIAVNHTKFSRFDWVGDIDMRSVYLNSHYGYTFTLDAGPEPPDDTKGLVLLDKSGRTLATSEFTTDLVTLPFHPPRTGTYYIGAYNGSDESAYDYTLTLRIK